MHSLRASRRADKQISQRRTAHYYGWLMVGASFVIVLLNTGVQSSFGNFLKPMSATFGWDWATVSIPAALATLLSGLFQPFDGCLSGGYCPFAGRWSGQLRYLGAALFAEVHGISANARRLSHAERSFIYATCAPTDITY